MLANGSVLNYVEMNYNEMKIEKDSYTNTVTATVPVV